MSDPSRRRFARRQPRRSRLAASIALLGLAACLSGARAQTSPEVQATTAAIPDFEFDSARKGVYCPSCNFNQGNSRLTFTDANGNLWVGGVDWQTGAFVPADGHGALLDTGTAPVPIFGNGPEWMSSAAYGAQILYTKFVPGHEGDANYATLGVATLVNGTWVKSVFSNSLQRATAEGTLEENDPDARFNYIKSDKKALYWRRLSQPDVELPLPISDMTDGNARRWVPGTHKIIFQGEPRSTVAAVTAAGGRTVMAAGPAPDVRNPAPQLQVARDQVFTYDTDTGQLEQLTNDPDGFIGTFMWNAPEYNNELVFLTMPKARQSIKVFRKLKGADGVFRWTVVKTIATGTTSALPFFFSPEPLVHNGRSYLIFQLSPDFKFYDKSIPTHIGMSGIDPLKNDLRVLTSGGPPRVRLDPEYFITAKGPFIYFNRAIPENASHPAVNDGVWYVDTKLGPPKTR